MRAAEEAAFASGIQVEALMNKADGKSKCVSLSMKLIAAISCARS
jgi:hypothetical protein